MNLRHTSACLFALVLTVLCSASAAPAQTRPAGSATPAVESLPPDFLIGPEDVLGVLFWREPEISGDVTVRPDGMITLPLVGDIKAAGRRPEALRDEIQLAAAKFLTEPSATVLLRQINSRKVFIVGQVGNPGSYPLVAPRSVMQLIATAGGPTEYAKREEISILRERGGKTQAFKFNYKEIEQGKKLEQNIQLQPGDTVIVP